MKRRNGKMSLHRETLLSLDPASIGRAGGGAFPPVETGYTDCVTRCASGCCPNEGGSGSYGSCFASCGVCSAACATGGACTL